MDWLLEPECPPIRYLALTQLLGRSPRDREARDARKGIPDWRPIRRMLSFQRDSGGWDEADSWYHPKHRSTVWQLIILSQTGIDPNHPPIRRMCEYAFKFQLDSGHFVGSTGLPGMEDWGRLAGCLNGNVIASLCRLGHARDVRISRAVEALLSFQEPDGGWGCRSFGVHRRDEHSCFMGTICALDGLIEYSEGRGKCDIESSKAAACEFLLMHRLFKADHHGWRTIQARWLELGSPRLVGYDILRGLKAVARSGITDDPRIEDALAVLESKRSRNGKWKREARWYSNAYSSFGNPGEEDKWVTLDAMRVLALFGQLTVR